MHKINKIKPYMKWIFVGLTTIIIFYLIFRSVPFQDLANTLINANIGFILLSVIPLCLTLVILAKRWQVILDALGYHIPLKECFTTIIAAMPFSTITPSKSGDVIRAYYLKDKIPVTRTVGSVISERVFDLIILIIFSLGGMLYYEKYDFFSVGIIVLLVGVAIIAGLYFGIRLPLSTSCNEKIENICLSIRMLIDNKKALFVVFGYSMLIWLLVIIQTLMFFYALNIDVSVPYLLGNFPIAIFIGLLPVTIGGMGTRDAAIIFLFSSFASSGQLLGVGLLFSFFRYWLLAGIGLVFMKKIVQKNIF